MSRLNIQTDLRRQLVERGLAAPEEIQGLPPDDIARLEQAAGVPFPRAYREFLEVAGGGAGVFQRGTSFFGKAIPRLRASAEALLRDEAPGLQLPDTALVFAQHGGYQMWFMDTAENPDDPPVYFFIFNKPEFIRIENSFSDYIAESIDVAVQIEQIIRGSSDATPAPLAKET